MYRPECCEKCLKRTEGKCEAYTKFQENCLGAQYNVRDRIKELESLVGYYISRGTAGGSKTVSDIRKEIKELKKQVYHEDKKHITQAIKEDQRRGEGGGGDSQKGNTAGIKQRMKDNRPLETKMTKAEKEAYKKAVSEFEGEHGKLPKYKDQGYGMSRSKVDSYTGDIIKEEK